MKSEVLNFLKIKVKKRKLIKKELRYKILQSIFQNKRIAPNKRLFSFMLLLNCNGKISKHKDICLLTSKTDGLYNNFGISRNCVKKLLNHNKIQNIRINSF
jgi:ribosomal protein S14